MFGLGKMKRGFVDSIIPLVIGIILVVSVALPVTTSVIKDQNATLVANYSTASTILNLFPLFIVLLGLILIAGYLVMRR